MTIDFRDITFFMSFAITCVSFYLLGRLGRP